MEIVYHLGVHLTDEERIPKTLLKNRAVLADERIIVPWPRQYRYLFRDLLGRLNGLPANTEIQNLILDSVMVEDQPERVIFAHENYLCMRPGALAHGRLYPSAGDVASALRNLFPDHPVSFRLAVRNPATFIPALFAAAQPADYTTFMAGIDPARLRWSEMIGRMREAAPDAPITFWCNEDSAVLWPVILQAVAGHRPETRLSSTDEFLSGLMSAEGFTRMQSYFAEHPPTSEERRRRAVAAFLEKFGLAEEFEMELDLPGWTEDYVEALTLAYDADVAEAARIPGVTLIG